MKIINLDSKYELTKAQISFAESVIICGEDEPRMRDDSISILMNEIPIFLVSPKTQKEFANGDRLGFYQHSARILISNIPIIGLCVEEIINCVNNEEELTILIAKVLIHEFAHAKMRLHPKADYGGRDEFYQWMEESHANLITLFYFRNYEYCIRHRRKEFAYATKINSPFQYVKDFIATQPDNYRFALDLFEHRLDRWVSWRNFKSDFAKNTPEKADWLDYVKNNVGNTDRATLERLFDALHRKSSEEFFKDMPRNT